jgi:hypothetical protein
MFQILAGTTRPSRELPHCASLGPWHENKILWRRQIQKKIHVCGDYLRENDLPHPGHSLIVLLSNKLAECGEL